MKNFFLFLFLLCSTVFYAQSIPFKITGKILSKKDKSPIESATIHIERPKDSTVTTYTISDAKGLFSLAGKSFDKNVTLYISYIGHQTYTKKITFNGKPIHLGAIYILEDNTLDEVVITSRAPITIKKDTLEFNVKSFKTKKDANVEDLLKKLPGVEVDENGKITVNGKPVNKILVNGKPFFGNDPTITTKNLSKEIIEKVQITNTKTKAEAFTGQKGDDDNKTINLTIKKENNKGWFGRIAAGKGTDNRYEFASMINRFNNDTRVSVLIGGNNTNSPGFSFGEIEKMFGGNVTSMSYNSNGSFSVNGFGFGGNSGIVSSKNVGVTYADKLGKKTDISANYFYSSSNAENKSTRNRENILPNSRYFSTSTSNSFNDNNNHNLSFELEIEIDSTFMIDIYPSFTFNKRESNSDRLQESFDENHVLTNKSTSSNSINSTVNNFENNIDITKNFGKNGAFLELDFTNSVDKTKSNRYNRSSTEIINGNTEIRNQLSDINYQKNGIRSRLLYRQPLIGKELYLDFSYLYGQSKKTNTNSTFDFDNNTQDFTAFNTSLSTDFTYYDTYKTPAIRLGYKSKKWRISFKTGYVFKTLESIDKLRPHLNVKRDFNALELTSRFRFRFSRKASTYAGYTLRNSSPSLNQLQAFEDISNPLNTVIGNPNLKPTDNHRFFAGYHQFNFQKGVGFFGYSSFSYANNNVVAKTTVDPNTLIRKTTYENVNGNYRFYMSGSYNKRFKLDTLSTLKIRTGLSINSNKNINFFNGHKYSANTTSLTPNIGLTYSWNKILEIEPRYYVSLSNTYFDLSNFKTQKYTQHTLRIRTKTIMPKKLEWRNDVRYTYNPNIEAGFQKSAWFWNSTLAYSMFKDRGILSLKAYDLLNQNTNSRRTSTANYIEDSESTVLQQYFMLSFSWKFNTLGKKGEVRNRRMFWSM